MHVFFIVAPPLDNMGKKMQSGHMEAAGDNYDAQEYLKPVTVTDTIRNPAQLAYVIYVSLFW